MKTVDIEKQSVVRVDQLLPVGAERVLILARVLHRGSLQEPLQLACLLRGEYLLREE